MVATLRPAGRIAAALLAVAAGGAGAQAPTPPSAASGGAATAAAASAIAFATVGDVVLTVADYERALAVATRQKYYHAQPPEGELAKFQREVGDNLVNRILLINEAKRRGVQPDRAKIDATVAGYDRQYGGSANWKANRERMLGNVVPALENASLLERLEKIVRDVPEPSPAVARAYYDGHKDLFVEPEQVKLSVILLKVDPSSRAAVWDGAMAEARAIHKKLVAGADFAELAKLHSGDRTAAQGGAMDYTHRGMLPEAVHGVVDTLGVGQLAAPVRLLEGVAILRLDGRRPSKQRGFDEVRERAADLWRRAEGEARWKKLIADLRRATPVHIDESRYAPLPGSADKPRAG